PPAPGVFSALGLLEADVEHHLVRSFLRPLAPAAVPDLAAAFMALEREAEGLLHGEAEGRVELERFVDLKYQGQSFELTVPLPGGWGSAGSMGELATAFGREHARTYGHAAEGDPIQLVNLRLTAR